VASVELLPRIQDDFDRILNHLLEHSIHNALQRIAEIVGAIDVLQSNPHIGRIASGDTRELIIGQRAHGYVALYKYIEPLDTVFVLAIRSQREAGYDDV
jgi:plasmid stabilization system protein ParE